VIAVTSPTGVRDSDSQAMCHSKANLLGQFAFEAPPAYTAPSDAYDGILNKEKKAPPAEEDGGYGVGYGHAR
jgi:hypothetical protein